MKLLLAFSFLTFSLRILCGIQFFQAATGRQSCVDLKVHLKITFKLKKKIIKIQIFMMFDPFLTAITVEVKKILVQCTR